MRFFLILLAFLLPTAALAQSQVALTSEVFVERATVADDGSRTVSLMVPEIVTPGDRLVFILRYRNEGQEPASDFVVTNPIPDSVAFVSTESAGAVYSVDGGTNWGALDALSVAETDGRRRAAVPADVTHVRWRFSEPIPAAGSGEIRFRGVVK